VEQLAAGSAAPLGAAPAVGLADRYAAALFELARERNVLPAVAASIETLSRAMDGEPELRALIGSPLVGRADAGNAMGAVAASLGLQPLLANTLGVMARAGRLRVLPAFVRAFRARSAASRGEGTAEVVAAHPLSEAQKTALAERLRVRTGRGVALDIRVDPSLLGGLVVRIGSEQIDSSLRTRLLKLEQAMKG
jgi:F-type H+-transporting ATPase subunit delta